MQSRDASNLFHAANNVSNSIFGLRMENCCSKWHIKMFQDSRVLVVPPHDDRNPFNLFCIAAKSEAYSWEDCPITESIVSRELSNAGKRTPNPKWHRQQYTQWMAILSACCSSVSHSCRMKVFTIPPLHYVCGCRRFLFCIVNDLHICFQISALQKWNEKRKSQIDLRIRVDKASSVWCKMFSSSVFWLPQRWQRCPLLFEERKKKLKFRKGQSFRAKQHIIFPFNRANVTRIIASYIFCSPAVRAAWRCWNWNWNWRGGEWWKLCNHPSIQSRFHENWKLIALMNHNQH